MRIAIQGAEETDLSALGPFFRDVFSQEPWNEAGMCPRCKDAGDYGPDFSWGASSLPSECPKCGTPIVPFWTDQRVKAYLTGHVGTIGLVFYEGDVIVAWAWGYPISDEVFYIDTVGIRPEAKQRRGLRYFLERFGEFVDTLVLERGFNRIRTRTHDRALHVRVALRAMGFEKLEASEEDPERSYWEVNKARA